MNLLIFSRLKTHASEVVKDINSRYSGPYPISPKTQTSVSICFIVHPRKIPKNGVPINLKVGIVDQFGNKYWIKNIDFRST